MKRVLLVILLLVLTIIVSGLVSAQTTGCCCELDNYGEPTGVGFYPASEANCIIDADGYNHIWNNLIESPSECDVDCESKVTADACVEDDCQDVNTNVCMCGTKLIVQGSNEYCCAEASLTFDNNDLSSCIEACTPPPEVNTFSLSGTITNQNGDSIYNMQVEVDGQNTLTNTNGYYSFNAIDENNALDVDVVGSGLCDSDSETITFNADRTGINFELLCSVIIDEQCVDYNGECCEDEVENCPGSTGIVSRLDCSAGWSCYANCNICENINLGLEEDCSLNTCSTPDNAICNTDGGWDTYSLPAEFDEYCAVCGHLDGDCLHAPCVTDREVCDGDCPANCGPGDDPDCSYPSCGIFYAQEEASICDTYASTPVWVEYNLDVEAQRNVYCSECGLQDTINCQSVCGDGWIGAGEQCEIGQTGCDEVTCTWIQVETCNNGVLNSQTEECDPGLPEWRINRLCRQPEFTGCNQATCQCIPACDEERGPPTLFNPVLQSESYTVSLTWTLPGKCEDNTFYAIYVKRCSADLGEECNPLTIIHTDLDANSIAYQDLSSKESEMTYGYIVSLEYTDGTQFESETVYINTGAEECSIDQGETFCVGNEIVTCGENNELIYVINEQSAICGQQETYCQESDDGEARCISVGPCGECNSLYGLYGYFTTALPATSATDLFDVHYINPQGIENDDFTCNQLTNLYEACFFQTSDKTIKKLEGCETIESCYDLKTQTDCNRSNSCGKFLLGTDDFECEWESYNTELGLGVCRPKELSDQVCELCTDENPIFPVCNNQLCSLFGNCYYDEYANTCEGGESISCINYKSQDDCIGSGGNNFSLDGMNNQIANSTDIFNLKKCKWTSDPDGFGDNCYRDADDNDKTFDGASEGDCGQETTVCGRDFTAPVIVYDTSIYNSNNTFGKNFEFPFEVHDDIYPVESLFVYSCFYNSTDIINKCLDTAKASAHAINGDENYQVVTLSLDRPDTILTYEFEDSDNDLDNYTIYFFSRDEAKNLEIVQNYSFSVDAKNPDYEVNNGFSYDYVSEQIGEDWMNRLWADFNFTEEVTCNITLTSQEITMEDGGIGTSTLATTSKEFHVDYPMSNERDCEGMNNCQGLSDGDYTFIISCFDAYGNPVTKTEPMVVEGDKSISHPTPKFEKFSNTEITLSVDTIYYAECRYSTETNRYEDMESELSDDSLRSYQGAFDPLVEGTHHSKTITFPGSGVYEFFTACEITFAQPGGGTTTEITEENDADKIIFSIDQLTPFTTVRNAYNKMEIESDRYYKSVDVEFVCEEYNYYDDTSTTPTTRWGMNLGDFWDGSFGCNDTYISYTRPNNPSEGGWLERPVTMYDPKVIFLPMTGEDEGDYVFSYRSVDRNDSSANTEQLKTLTVRIDQTISEMGMDVTDNGVEVSILTYGVYSLNFISTKPIEDVVRLSYSFRGSTVNIVDQVASTGPNTFRAYLRVTPDNLFYNQEGEMSFSVEIRDYHGMIATSNEFRIDIDTKGPPAPIPEPIFGTDALVRLPFGSGESFLDANGNWYPFRYYDEITIANGSIYENIFILNQTSIYVTGYTSEYDGLVQFFIIKQDSDGYNPIYTYDQNAMQGEVDEVSILPIVEIARKGSNYVLLNTNNIDMSTSWSVGKYLNFGDSEDKKARTDYGAYGKYYEITDTNFLGVPGQRVSVTPTLEENFEAETDVYLYNKDFYYKWFGQEFDFTSYWSESGDNFMYVVFGLDDGLNEGFSNRIPLFIDTESPLATTVSPTSGILDGSQALVIEFMENIEGAGIKEDSLRVEISVNGENIQTYEADELGLIEIEDNNTDDISYRIEFMDSASEWDNGNYDITIYIEDQAGNLLDTSNIGLSGETNFGFIVDHDVPPAPLFSVVGATEDNVDTFGRTVVSDLTPSFTLDFSQETLNVAIPTIELLEQPIGIDASINCTRQSGNVFTCTFEGEVPEGLYSISATTYKTLDNDINGPQGEWVNDVEGKLMEIIVDRTAPEFELELESQYVRPEERLTIQANVDNEFYDLIVDFVVEEERDTLTTTKRDNTYTFTVPSDFNWGVEGTKDLSVSIRDYAGHVTEKAATVFYDTTPPSVTITSITADRGFLISNTEAVVGDWNVTITGIIDSDVYSVCYDFINISGEGDCIEECVGEEANECIGDVNEFSLTMIITGRNSEETLNSIEVIVSDYAGYTVGELLSVLLDLRAPERPIITFE